MHSLTVEVGAVDVVGGAVVQEEHSEKCNVEQCGELVHKLKDEELYHKRVVVPEECVCRPHQCMCWATAPVHVLADRTSACVRPPVHVLGERTSVCVGRPRHS
jgi:hypothetical protein